MHQTPLLTAPANATRNVSKGWIASVLVEPSLLFRRVALARIYIPLSSSITRATRCIGCIRYDAMHQQKIPRENCAQRKSVSLFVQFFLELVGRISFFHSFVDIMKILLLATILATVGAYCPNACSGHGSCGINGKLSFIRLNFANRFLFFDLFSPYHSSISFQTSVLVIIVPMAILHGQDMIAP